MFLSVATTHRPATDLGFLLMKHPDRVHEAELSFGRALVFFPESTEQRCEAALVLDIDPIGLVRGHGNADGLLDQYVNDRPYAASSFMSVAMNKVFRSAMTGTSRERPELADKSIPLEIVVTPVPLRGDDAIVRNLFEPLGWSVAFERLAGRSGASRYIRLQLGGEMRLSDALSHLYVLIPVLDDAKHYWVSEDEVEKLLARAAAWLPGHPERDMITRRYLKSRRDLVRLALARLAPEEADDAYRAHQAEREDVLEVHDLRLETVAAALAASQATRVADLGCGEGKLISMLVANQQFTKIIGLDASARMLERAAERLSRGRPGGPLDGRVVLLHGALTYRDERWRDVDAVALVEVIEHLDPDRLPAFEDVVFGAAGPKTVVLTTPNADYNALFPTLAPGSFRHPDHRFEWTREQFRAWASRIEARHGYSAVHTGIGTPHPEFGAISQVVVFSR